MMKLTNPVKYFPIEKPIYEVAPHLKPFGMDLGGGDQDKKIFQFDSLFPLARESKLKAHAERISKYYLNNAPVKHNEILSLFLIDRLVMEWPQFFTVRLAQNKILLQCHLTKEELIFDMNGRYRDEESKSALYYLDAIDALVMQVQEDIAWVVKETDGKDSDNCDGLKILHVMSPSHWSPEVKFNQSFFNVHAPIPGVEKLNKSANQMVDAMINKGPFLRMVWSFVTDQNFNHHPDAPKGTDPKQWKGRSFDLENKPENPFDLRVERQITWGFKELNAALFTIRISFLEGQEVKTNKEWRELLSGAIESMSPASLEYKGLSHCKNELLNWLLTESV